MKISIDSRARALIFDIDGTLADSMPLHYAAWQEAVSPGPFLTYERYLGLSGVPGYGIVDTLNRELGLSFNPPEILSRKEEIFLRRINTVRPIEPLVSLVKSRYHVLPMAAGTGARRHMAELTLKLIGLDGYFNIIVSSDDVTKPKPAPETFLKCAHLLGIDPAACQVFEDGDAGIEAARSAGMMVTDVRTIL